MPDERQARQTVKKARAKRANSLRRLLNVMYVRIIRQIIFELVGRDYTRCGFQTFNCFSAFGKSGLESCQKVKDESRMMAKCNSKTARGICSARTVRAKVSDAERGIIMAANLKRRFMRAAGWRVAKRLIKPIPVLGSMLAVGLAGHEIRKKGLLRGVTHVSLDVTPVIGTAKGIIELFTGDLISDKEEKTQKAVRRLPAT